MPGNRGHLITMATTIHEPVHVDAREKSSPALADSGGRGGGRFVPEGGTLRTLEDRSSSPTKTGIWVVLAAVTMSFAALTSALLVRQGSGNDWRHIVLPPILYANTLTLLVSSVTLEMARRRFARTVREAAGDWTESLRALYGTLALGSLFVVGQYIAWLRLRADGLYLASNPTSSFFYVFTGVHALHVLGGLAGLIYAAQRLRGSRLRRSSLDAVSHYWHFVDVLWLYLLFVLWTKL